MTEHSYEDFLELHESQLLTSAVPEKFWKPLYEKLKNSTLDAGEKFQIVVEQNEEEGTQSHSVVALNDLSANDPDNIFLIDHAWTFHLDNTTRVALQNVSGLKERLMESFGIKAEDLMDADDLAGSDYVGSESGSVKEKPHFSGSKEGGDGNDSDHSSAPSINEMDGRIINRLLEVLPKFMGTYTMKVQKSVIDNSSMPVWYINDEFGLNVGHSTEPNHFAYTLLFPLKDIKAGEEVTRNYVAQSLYNTRPEWYHVFRLPWEEADLTNEPIKFSHKDDAYFLDGRIPDQIDGLSTGPAIDQLGVLDTVQIYATDNQLLKNLREVQFEITDDPFKADVIWSREHFHDFAALAKRNPKALINQFPFESALTVKDLFAACVHACPGFEKSFDEEKLEWTFPSFYPATFNLNEELPSFVTYYQKRKQKGLENSFIVKPWNLGRGLDISVTDNLNQIIRLCETGPKLASKYVQNPVLFRRPDSGNVVKFDLRYIVFVRSIEPLSISVYNKFWPRCAIDNYDLQTLDNIFAHLSVFNYTEKEKVLNIRCEEFVSQLQVLHPQIKWEEVQKKIDDAIVEVLKVVKRKPPCGIAPNSQSRAMYGFDIMLNWSDENQKHVEVKFLEANFMPDCQRACEFYKDFADTAFQTLFLGGGSKNVRQLC
ncbi:hypothetical protein M3Y97_00629900 [Aphelenchoides bicaudatus]|nr:hypothetical protein M3Y97_00629900 [Aphelenchoides bicaudatus]